MNKNNNLIISYLSLREAIGVMGFSLPFILWLGGWWSEKAVQPTISHYYHSNMHDVFVGYLFAISVFLMAYRGYETIDMWCGKVAGLAGIGVALFPNLKESADCASVATTPISQVTVLIGKLHYLSATVFFLTLAFFCLFLFTKSSSPDQITPMKARRNWVYRGCGVIILLCMVGIGLYALLNKDICHSPSLFPPVFVLESIAVMAFGFSWFVKGEGILVDQK